ncbi:hypothetical protein P7C73_g4865, partial [Tremellales sp. Uapishka_1]
MDVQVTPRKRKARGDEEGSSGKGNKHGSGVPTPNPPLAPFPTPPSSRHRSGPVLSSPPQPVFTSPSSSKRTYSHRTALPPHLQTLLKLHQAFNLALALHIATHPPVLPPHSATTTKVLLPNLTNFLAIKESVERSSGRRFGLPELGRLAWMYDWDGKALPSDTDDQENPFLVTEKKEERGDDSVVGLGYVISTTRTLDAAGKKVYTYGLGIELELRVGETREILLGGAEGGIGNKGQGGGVGAIGRWSGGG